MIVPEITLFNYFNKIVESLKKDTYENGENSFLYRHLKGKKYGNYDMYEELKVILGRPHTVDNYLDVRLFFDAKRANLPTVHITLPLEKGGKNDGIGVDEGYEDPRENIVGSYPVKARGFDTSYSIIISSSNTLETLSIYTMLKAILITHIDILGLMGFNNVVISGGDLQLNPDIIPNGVFLRSITLNFDYKVVVEKLIPDNWITNIIFESPDIVK